MPGLGQALLPSDDGSKMWFCTMQRSTSVFLLLFILFSGNIDILGYNGGPRGVIQTDSGSRSFLYSLGVILYYGLALGPLLSCPALRRASCNFNFCAQSLCFTVSWGGDGKRGDPPAWRGKKPPQSAIPVRS